MTRIIRSSRLVRKNQVLSSFVERKSELAEATASYEKAYAKLKADANRVLQLYVPLKNAVSTKRWDRKRITKIKIVCGGQMLELTLYEHGSHGYEHKSYWKFPSWMIGATTERIVEGLNKIIDEDKIRFEQQETDRAEKKRLEKLAELKAYHEKYLELISTTELSVV